MDQWQRTQRLPIVHPNTLQVKRSAAEGVMGDGHPRKLNRSSKRHYVAPRLADLFFPSLLDQSLPRRPPTGIQ